jgi:hypothetical protein
MKIGIGIFLIFATLSLSHLCFANSITGLEMQHHCAKLTSDAPIERGSAFDAGLCGGFIDGVMDGMYYMAVNKAKTFTDVKMPFCLPSDVSNEQIVKVYMKFLNDHPENLNDPATVLLVRALTAAFPCKIN